jgi:hypothetical protein
MVVPVNFVLSLKIMLKELPMAIVTINGKRERVLKITRELG